MTDQEIHDDLDTLLDIFRQYNEMLDAIPALPIDDELDEVVNQIIERKYKGTKAKILKRSVS